VYSLRGRSSVDPLRSTAANFIGAVPMVAIASLFIARGHHVTTQGLLLAVASGAITSGLGYVVWYAALRHSQRRACGNRAVVGAGHCRDRWSPVTRRAVDATACCSRPVATLGGIALVVGSRQRRAN
jgi:hypothetical protein